jgi:hypothetical protein
MAAEDISPVVKIGAESSGAASVRVTCNGFPMATTVASTIGGNSFSSKMVNYFLKPGENNLAWQYLGENIPASSSDGGLVNIFHQGRERYPLHELVFGDRCRTRLSFLPPLTDPWRVVKGEFQIDRGIVFAQMDGGSTHVLSFEYGGTGADRREIADEDCDLYGYPEMVEINSSYSPTDIQSAQLLVDDAVKGKSQYVCAVESSPEGASGIVLRVLGGPEGPFFRDVFGLTVLLQTETAPPEQGRSVRFVFNRPPTVASGSASLVSHGAFVPSWVQGDEVADPTSADLDAMYAVLTRMSEAFQNSNYAAIKQVYASKIADQSGFFGLSETQLSDDMTQSLSAVCGQMPVVVNRAELQWRRINAQVIEISGLNGAYPIRIPLNTGRGFFSIAPYFGKLHGQWRMVM